MKQATRKPTTPGDILLYEYLEPLDLKINELAELLHVHRNSVSALINNNRSTYSFGLNRSNRLALLTTVIDESAIAAPATTGLSSVPVNGHKIPAATGIPMLL